MLTSQKWPWRGSPSTTQQATDLMKKILVRNTLNNSGYHVSHNNLTPRIDFTRQFDRHLQNTSSKAELIPRLNHTGSIIFRKRLVLLFSLIPLNVVRLYSFSHDQQATIGCGNVVRTGIVCIYKLSWMLLDHCINIIQTYTSGRNVNINELVYL